MKKAQLIKINLELFLGVHKLIGDRWKNLNVVIDQLISDGWSPLRTFQAVTDIQQAYQDNRETDQELREHFIKGGEIKI